MRLFRLHAWSRAAAVLVLLASTAGVPHLDKGDAACVPAAVGEHDESKHAFRATGSVEHTHCAICHSSRLSRYAFAPNAAHQAPLSAGLAIELRDPFTRRAPALDKLPARAPPVRL